MQVHFCMACCAWHVAFLYFMFIFISVLLLVTLMMICDDDVVDVDDDM